MQCPNHVGGVEQRSSPVFVGAPLHCRCGGLQIDHSIPSRPACRDADLVTHLANADNGALEKPPLSVAVKWST